MKITKIILIVFYCLLNKNAYTLGNDIKQKIDVEESAEVSLTYIANARCKKTLIYNNISSQNIVDTKKESFKLYIDNLLNLPQYNKIYVRSNSILQEKSLSKKEYSNNRLSQFVEIKKVKGIKKDFSCAILTIDDTKILRDIKNNEPSELEIEDQSFFLELSGFNLNSFKEQDKTSKNIGISSKFNAVINWDTCKARAIGKVFKKNCTYKFKIQNILSNDKAILSIIKKCGDTIIDHYGCI